MDHPVDVSLFLSLDDGGNKICTVSCLWHLISVSKIQKKLFQASTHLQAVKEVTNRNSTNSITQEFCTYLMKMC